MVVFFVVIFDLNTAVLAMYQSESKKKYIYGRTPLFQNKTIEKNEKRDENIEKWERGCGKDLRQCHPQLDKAYRRDGKIVVVAL